MTNNIPSQESFKGVNPDANARYQAAHKKTQQLREKIQLNKELQEKSAKYDQYVSIVSELLEQNGITQEKLESDFLSLLQDIGANPEEITSEQFAEVIESNKFIFLQNFYSQGSDGYEYPQGNIGDFLHNLNELKDLETKLSQNPETKNYTQQKINEIKLKIEEAKKSFVYEINKLNQDYSGSNKIIIIPNNIPVLPSHPDADTKYGDVNNQYMVNLPQIHFKPNGDTISASLEN